MDSSSDTYEESYPDAPSPLCFFYFSHPFSIKSYLPRVKHFHSPVLQLPNKKPRHKSCRTAVGTINNGRKEKRRRRNTKRRTKWTLVKYLTESVRVHSERLPSLKDVVDTLQSAWSSDNDFSKCFSKTKNENNNLNFDSMAYKINNNNNGNQEKILSGLPSPVMLRRRLSAPETIMRKHALNQLRSNSSETDTSQLSSLSSLRLNNSGSFWNRGSTTGSDSNLSFRKPYNKRDPDLMRKSTLLRRMWSREFTGSISRLYNDEIFPKKSLPTQSRSPVRSVRSSLEQINKVQGKFSPEMTRTKTSDATNSYSSFISDVTSRVSSTSESNKSILDTSSTDIKVSSTNATTTENDVYSTTNTENNIDNTSDSAYTNSKTYDCNSTKSDTDITNNNNNNFDTTTMTESTENLIAQGHLVDTQTLSEINSNANINDINTPVDVEDKKSILKNIKQKSFYLKSKEDVAISADHSRIMKYMISNVGTGSPYSKPTEVPQIIVPRFSALPRSESMEVNTSSAESTDKESDTASLVDSLDDPNSPRQSITTPRLKHDDKPVRGDLSILLPDNSGSCRETPRSKRQKGSAFYVPIEDETITNDKTVAERLPDKVRNKLSKRQQEMEQKKIDVKNKIDNHCFDPNGNQSYNIISNPIVQHTDETELEKSWSNTGIVKKVKKDKKAKQLLRSLPSYKINARGELVFNANTTENFKKGIRQTKRRYSKNSDSSESSSNKVAVSPLVWNNQSPQKSLSIHVSKNEYVPEEEVLNKTQEKVSCNNTIEILEIMECVEQTTGKSLSKNYSRSKIPVLMQTKVAEVPHKQVQMQTVYHAYDLSQVPQYSPKTDRLIANILIDALNQSDIQITPNITVNHPNLRSNEKRPPPISPNKQVLHRYEQKFEIIPEEKLSSLGSSAEESTVLTPFNPKLIEAETQVESKEFHTSIQLQTEKKYLMDASSQTDAPGEFPNFPKGRAALAMMKDEDFASIPKGWITFYLLRKSPESPNSSTDEGTPIQHSVNSKMESVELHEMQPVLDEHRFEQLTEAQDTICSNNTELNTSNSFETLVISKNDQFSSSSDTSKNHSPNDEKNAGENRSTCPTLPVALPPRQGRRQSHRRSRYKTTFQNQEPNSSQIPGGWSVTVSGTSASGQPAPDLEMRLKFPSSQGSNQTESSLGDKQSQAPRHNLQHDLNKETFHLPPSNSIQTKKYTVITRKHTNDSADNLTHRKNFQYLPDLVKNKNQRQKQFQYRDYSVPVTHCHQRQQRQWQRHRDVSSVTAMPPILMRQNQMSSAHPKQTITSYRRFSLNHSSHVSSRFPTTLPLNPASSTEESIQLPECFSSILAVTGSAISPENKPKMPSMSERDLTRNHLNFGHHI